MRIVFINLHADWMLVKTSSVMVYKFSPALKHGYLLNYLLSHPQEYEVCNYINDRGFSLFTKGSNALQKFLNLFSKLENRIILGKNDIDRKKIKVITNSEEIRPDDIVIAYNFHHEHYRGLQNVKGFKALSFLHFHGKAEEDKLIKDAKVDCYFNEANLYSTSELYRYFYHEEHPWIVIPFVFAQRFQNKKPFSERQNKAFSVGTITYKVHPEYFEVYKERCLQPIRKLVKDFPEYYADTIDCYSEDYHEGDIGKKVTAKDHKIVALYKRIYNRFHNGRQKKYFSFDMVEKFNNYKMCIVGEERIGLPGIGFVEGMACGCAYLGIDSPMYRDYGLVPGVHYISYDGTKNGLRKTIEYYQAPEHQDELEHIAKTGCEFVRKNFQGDVVAEHLMKELVRLRDEKLATAK